MLSTKMKLVERERHYFKKFNIHPYTLIELHGFAANVRAAHIDKREQARRADMAAKMRALLKGEGRSWTYHSRMGGFPRNLQCELQDCEAFYRETTQLLSVPEGLTPDKWVFRNLAPFFRSRRLAMDLLSRIVSLKKKEDAAIQAKHPDKVRLADIRQDIRRLRHRQRGFEEVAWEELACFVSGVPGGTLLQSHRPQKRRRLQDKLESEVGEEDIPFEMLKVNADRIKHLCYKLPPNLPMNTQLAYLLKCQLNGTIPSGFPDPASFLLPSIE
ncbi:MAG: hypothetical protein OJF50_006281 [Nitrospira sp.]|jgi:hypothetical protein|nr:hypothetical protein [Nitrospira sp.]